MPGRTVNGLGGSSSRKRPRPDTEHVVSVEQARSDLRSDNVKRVRLSNVGSGKGKHRETTPSDDDPEEDVEMEDDNVQASPPKTQYEEMRDGNFGHLEDEAQADHQVTQMFIRQSRQKLRQDELLGDNHAADNGILESITCVNFMCHERLHCELGPLLNFIVGENGSGKSAILTAITLCLGGKATSTNRGGSLKSFIKEGCDRASLQVKIKNEGDGAYRPELYGGSIVVERNFSKGGVMGFKVKSAEGQVISTKKSEVDEIVEYYALQVDNPLNVLSQDNARQFLNAATPAQKYKYFAEGVQLEQLDRDYRLTCEFADLSESKLPLQRERLDALKKEHDEAKRVHRLADETKQLRKKLALLRHQLLWSQVVGSEREVAGYEQAIKEKDEEIAAYQRDIDTKAAQLEQCDTKITEAKTAAEAAKVGVLEYQAGVEAMRAAYDESQRQLQQFHNDERNANSEAKAAQAQVANLGKEIEKEKRRLEATQGDQVVRQRERIETDKAECEKLKQEAEDVKKQIPELNKRCEASQNNLNEVKRAIAGKKKDIDNVRGRINQIQRDNGNKYAAYEAGVPNLIRALADDNSFKVRPIGPIGAHVKLLQPKWSTILESWFGANLNCFIVTCMEDSRKLEKLMKRFNVSNCGIMVGSRDSINTSGHEPEGRFDTILRTLSFDNDMVRTQLIISNAIEQVILIPERTKGEEVMFSPNRPRNVRQCLCFHDTIRSEGHVLKSGQGGRNLATEPIRPGRQRPRMQADSGSAIMAQQEILEFLQTELRGLEKRKQDIEQEHELNLAEVRRKSGEKTTLDTEIKRLEMEIDQIASQLDKNEGADVRLEDLTVLLEEQKLKGEHFKTQYADIHVKKQTYNKEVEAKKKALEDEKKRKREFQKKVLDAEERVKKVEHLRNITLAEKNVLHTEVDYAKQERRRLEQKREKAMENVKQFTKQAEELAPDRVHIPEGETYESITANYNSLGAQLKELQRQRGISDEEAHRRVVETKELYEKAQSDYQVNKQSSDKLKKALAQRLLRWREFQKFISAAARAKFQGLLRERNFKGKLMLDHRQKKLALRVEPANTDPSAKGQNTKTLSGGEKSFSSICLLLSIWEAMGSPLRCLDEFDVFMDNINRRVSTNMLMSAARESTSRQYILITPNAIEGRAKLDKDVKIIRLTDPRQSRLADF